MFNKKYKKGMADAAKAYEAFGKKQEDAINQILEEVRKQGGDFAETIKSLNVNIDGLYDYLQSKEKAQLYTVYTPFDIKDLDKEEQLFLIGALFRLTTDKAPNEHQQDYLRSIQRYLDIKEPPFGTDPLAIENIEDIPAQKAILQAVMEYLYLQDGDSYDETELQQEFLDAFSVNNKGRQAIFEQVERLYKATGARGLAEKYGYVVEEEVEGDVLREEDSSPRAKGMSEELAKKIYDFPKDVMFALYTEDEFVTDDVIETEKYILIKWEKIEKTDKLDRLHTLRTICKMTGEEKVIQNIDRTIVNDGWSSTNHVGDKVLIFTENNELFSLDLETETCKFIVKRNDYCKIIDATKDRIYLHSIYSNSPPMVVDWNGKDISDGMNQEELTELSFFHNEVLWSVYNDGWSDNAKWKLLKFVPGKRNMEIVLESSKGFKAEHIVVFNAKLYILAQNQTNSSYDYSRYSVFSVNLEVPTEFQVLQSDITIYRKAIYKSVVRSLLKGWVFIGEVGSNSLREYKLMYFSCENKELAILAKGCGDRKIETHIFKEDDVYYHISRIEIVGNYAFFKVGDSITSKTKAMVSIYEPMNVKLLS